MNSLFIPGTEFLSCHTNFSVYKLVRKLCCIMIPDEGTLRYPRLHSQPIPYLHPGPGPLHRRPNELRSAEPNVVSENLS